MQDTLENESKYEEDVLQIILNESRDLRNQQLDHLSQNSENIWGSLNFLMIMLGIYISMLLFLCEPDNVYLTSKSIIVCPLVFSILFISVAIIRCITGIFPTNMFKVPTTNAIYGLVVEEKETVLNHLIQTYLIGYGSIIVKTEERNSLRKEIIIVALASIVEFILFALMFLFKNQVIALTTISIIFAAIFTAFILNFKEKEKKRIELIKENITS